MIAPSSRYRVNVAAYERRGAGSVNDSDKQVATVVERLIADGAMLRELRGIIADYIDGAGLQINPLFERWVVFDMEANKDLFESASYLLCVAHALEVVKARALWM